MNFSERFESIAICALCILALVVLAPFFIFVVAVALLWHEPRIGVGIALGLLLSAAVSLTVGEKGVAEGLAVYAYLFLASGVIVMLIKYVKEEWGKVEGQEGK